ncbi:MAG: hypothetical protein OXK80_03325 [Bdellovibrionales bacterium]|nr:hypothetical protein [Bdellovibrionales bacterium]
MQIKVFIFLFFLGCGSAQLNSETFDDWCFEPFKQRDNFYEYLNIHEEYAKSDNNVESMRLAGCAYYQKGDLDLAEQWLSEAYQNGHKGVPVDLTAIYLKEGDLERALTWYKEKENTLESERIRWLDIVVPMERYRHSNERMYLSGARSMLEHKIRIEGDTPVTLRLMETIDDLIEEETQCARRDHGCSYARINEKKASIHVFSRGVLSSMVPDIPKSWNYEEGEVGLLPIMPNKEDTV